MSPVRIRRRLRRVVAAALAGAAALVLAGCIGIPTTGGVTTKQIGAAPAGSPLLSLPLGPQTDATPAQIIQGFIRAGRGPQSSYGVARLYLTDTFKNDWRPSDRTIISDGVITPAAIESNTYRVAVAITADVDNHGVMRTTLPTPTESLVFGLVQDTNGQWRISSAPNLTIVPQTVFDVAFGAYPLYFFDPAFRYLVPDMRWFLTTRAPDRIVGELLTGPVDWLAAPVLVSSFPSSTQLDAAGVSVQSGQATVPLSSTVSGESDAAKQRMQQQLRASLKNAGVTDVQMTVSGFTVAVGSGGPAADSSVQVGTDVVGGLNGQFGVITADGVTTLRGVDAAADPLAARGGTLAHSRDAAALLGKAGVYRVSAGTATVVDARPNLTAPSLDPNGFIWSAPAADIRSLRVIAPSGAATALDVPVDGSVVSLAVSRDGTRLLIAQQTASGPAVTVLGIVRAADGTPTGFGPAEPKVPLSPGALIAAAWVDGAQIAVLSGAADGTTSVDAYVLGGQRTALGTLQKGREIVGGNGVGGIRVLDADGVVRQASGGATWLDSGIHASFLTTRQ